MLWCLYGLTSLIYTYIICIDSILLFNFFVPLQRRWWKKSIFSLTLLFSIDRLVVFNLCEDNDNVLLKKIREKIYLLAPSYPLCYSLSINALFIFFDSQLLIYQTHDMILLPFMKNEKKKKRVILNLHYFICSISFLTSHIPKKKTRDFGNPSQGIKIEII